MLLTTLVLTVFINGVHLYHDSNLLLIFSCLRFLLLLTNQRRPLLHLTNRRRPLLRSTNQRRSGFDQRVEE